MIRAGTSIELAYQAVSTVQNRKDAHAVIMSKNKEAAKIMWRDVVLVCDRLGIKPRSVSARLKIGWHK